MRHASFSHLALFFLALAMKLIDTRRNSSSFAVLAKTRTLEAATMTLRKGEASDDAMRNEHPRSEKWLYVVSGTARATVRPRGKKARTVRLSPGSLLVIQKGEAHQVRNLGARPLQTINFYGPPAYDTNGRLLKRK